jgi:hypothetical protein
MFTMIKFLLVIRLLFIVLSFFSIINTVYSQSCNTLIKKTGEIISITGNVVGDDDSIVVVIESNRNKNISTFNKQSPDDPNFVRKRESEKQSNQEMWFPIIDIEIDNSTYLKAYFKNVHKDDYYCFNGNFNPLRKSLSSELILKKSLLHWENSIYVHSLSSSLPTLDSLLICKKIPVRASGNRNIIDHKLRLLSRDWTGKVSILFNNNKISSQTFFEKTIAKTEQEKTSLERETVIQSLKSTIRFLLNSRDINPYSPTYGGMYLLYDLDSRSYRRPDWVWSWGTTIRLLIEATEIPEISEEFGSEKLLKTAREIAETALRLQITENKHPAYGLFKTYISPRFHYTECGFGTYSGPADSYFLVGYGLLPLYEKINDERYLKSSKICLEQTARILQRNSVIEQDYVLTTNKWKDWTMDESGFGMLAFHKYYNITNDESIKYLGKEYFNGLQKVFQREDGLWDRAWFRNNSDREDDGWKASEQIGIPELMPLRYNTRGLAWAMIGLLAADELFPNENYLETAEKMSEHLKNYQHNNGSWSYNFNESKDDKGISEKGTGIWSFLFYNLYLKTRKREDLMSAQRALLWCMENQYFGDDIHARGGIVGITPASGIIYRKYYPIICTYTMSFFGLALLEELKIQNK